MASKHIVTFIGNGIHKDSLGELWFKGLHENDNIKSERTYDDSQYVDRSDLHFMVEYGSMKHTEIEIPEPPKAEIPKAETPKAEPPKAETPKAEPPKADNKISK